MSKIVLFFFCTAMLFASYNPFFSEPKKKVQQPPQTPPPAPKQVAIQTPELKIDAIYYGFVQTSRANYALLESNGKSFAISQGDSFYIDNQKLDIVKISSNQVVVRNQSRYKTIYFSRKE